MREGWHIGKRLSERVADLRSRLRRARYFRGHGVHSPFVYAIVRNVFMCCELLPGDRELYRALITQGVDVRRAVELQNLAIHCSYSTFGLNRAVGELCVATREASTELIAELTAAAAECGRTVVVLSPDVDAERCVVCRNIATNHPSTVVDNRAYLLIFNNHLPKQHFRI